MIVQELYRIQSQHGFLPRQELVALADRLALPLYRVQEVVSFFPHYHTKLPPKIEIQVCRDMACQLRGSGTLHDQLEALAAKHPAANAEVCFASCLGRCDRAPAVRICGNDAADDAGHSHTVRTLLGRSPDEVCEQVRAVLAGGSIDKVPHDSDTDYAAVDANQWRINIYANQPATERYASIRRFILASKDTEHRNAECKRIVQALETAGLLGMGGAGGRAFKKWSEVREAVGEQKYVVCNADESEPGTFKDRELLLRTPHLVLEGVVLAGLFLGATRGYIYVRHEYEEQIKALEAEIKAAQEIGACGDNIFGSGLSFPVEVFVSPGGYICGEQTALIEALEDKRAEPRNRPPELQTNGLWNMPTLLNNVETLAWVPSIVLRDEGRWYAQQGAVQQGAAQPFQGTRFFSVSGDVVRPGVYEVPIGITLGELLDKHAGGMRGGQKLKAVALSGPSGGFTPALLPADSLSPALKERLPPNAAGIDIRDLELDLGLFRKFNLMLGAGIIVYGENADLVEQAQVCLEFYRHESCGKCVPCRIGSTKLAEIGAALHAKQLDAAQIDALKKDSRVVELAAIMRQTAICGLGTVAANPLTTLLAHFEDDIRRHTKGATLTT